MQRHLQNTESVWWYVTREFEQTLGRPIDEEEFVTVTLVVSALTKLLADQTAAAAQGVRTTPGPRRQPAATRR